MKKILLIGFIAVAAIQWMVPLRMIGKNENILRHGRLVKFKTAPIDPANPLLGRYILLNFKEQSVKTDTSFNWEPGQPVFAVLKTDQEGFAHITKLESTKPADTTLFVKASVYYAGRDSIWQSVMLNFPFTRFYMDEYNAPTAANIYAERIPAEQQNKSYALINLLDGDAVIRDVMVNDTSIATLIGKRNASR